MPSTLSLAAGFAIGIGYQFQPFLHPHSKRSTNRRLATGLMVASGIFFGAAFAVVALGWAPRTGGLGLALLAISVMLLLVGLAERHPVGDNLPGIFLIPVGLDGLMLQSMAGTWSTPAQAAVALALFVPGTAAAVILTVWAFQIRRSSKPTYAKATETARGVLWAWALLVVGVLVWNGFGIAFTDSTWVNPVVWALPIVTVGSVLATATAGWSRFVEARHELVVPEG